MDDTTPASIDTLIETLYAAEPGDRFRITLPERPPYVVQVFTNDSITPQEGTDDGDPKNRVRIQVNVNVAFDETPVEEPTEIGTARGIAATRDANTGVFERPTLGVMVDSSPAPDAEPDWNADPRPIERLDELE